MGCAAPILRLGSSQIPEKRLVDALGPCLACLGCKYRLGSGSSKPFGNVDIPALVTLSQSSAVPVSKLGQVLSQEEDDEAIKTGPFAELMRPHEMQPIWLLPLSNGIKQLLTFFVFGFDFKTKFKTGSARMKILSFCAGFVAKLAFIFLSLNSYVSDFRKFQSRKANNLDNLWQSALIFLAIWCTSHNFSAALGLWGSFTIQSPAVIFEDDIDRPRYLPASACWGFGAVEFPFFIGGARWLQFPKQIYALLLLPYVIPYMLLSYGTAILLVAWLILFTKCWCT